MIFNLFMTYEADATCSAMLADWFEGEPRTWLASKEGVLKSDLFVPDPEKALFFDDGPAPSCILQIHAEHLEFLEELVNAFDFARLFLDGPVGLAPEIDASFGMFRTVRYPVAGVTDPESRTAPMSFVVRYYGPMSDIAAFHDFYVANHLPLLAQFPNVRNVFAYLPVSWRNPDLPQSQVLLGNEVVFDSVSALNAAMSSEIMPALRKDSSQFPPFGHSTHHATQRRDYVS